VAHPLTTYSVEVTDVGPVNVDVDQRGEGQVVLLLHGGAGPVSIAGFAQLVSDTRPITTIVPTHPGFGGTIRPHGLDSVKKLAAPYLGLLDVMDVTGATVVGSSLGGWVAAEMALSGSGRVERVVLVDAAGIVVPGHPVADVSTMDIGQIMSLSYFDAGRFRVDPATITDAQRAVMAGNFAALATYSGGPVMGDPTLRDRLAGVAVATLVLWGEADRIVDPAYGRAYADAIPGARFQLLSSTGHLPQIETPGQVLDALWEFVE